MVVFVTGAAGPLGSEICRQVARFQPLAIVGLDAAGPPLLDLQQEIRAAYPAVLFHPEIGSLRNFARLTDLFDRYGPSILYHPAAHTLLDFNLFAAAADYNLDDFITVTPPKNLGMERDSSTNLERNPQKNLETNSSTNLERAPQKNLGTSRAPFTDSTGSDANQGCPQDSFAPLDTTGANQDSPLVSVTAPQPTRFRRLRLPKALPLPEAVQLLLQASLMN
jgi:NAD(P)-dependent dehydrogenase (short-subunit alcohol dehydrogenase family)